MQVSKLSPINRAAPVAALLLLVPFLAWLTFTASLSSGYRSLLQMLTILNLALIAYVSFRINTNTARTRYLSQVTTFVGWLVILCSLIPLIAWLSSLGGTNCGLVSTQCFSPSSLLIYATLSPFVLPPVLVITTIILVIGITIDITGPRRA